MVRPFCKGAVEHLVFPVDRVYSFTSLLLREIDLARKMEKSTNLVFEQSWDREVEDVTID